jgi:hypothetical protein
MVADFFATREKPVPVKLMVALAPGTFVYL